MVRYTLPMVASIPNLDYKTYIKYHDKTDRFIDHAIVRAQDEDCWFWHEFLAGVFKKLEISSVITDISVSCVEPPSEKDKIITPGNGEFWITLSWTSCSLTEEQMMKLEYEVEFIQLFSKTELKEMWGDDMAERYEYLIFPTTDSYYKMKDAE
jgi:hypothetical protein